MCNNAVVCVSSSTIVPQALSALQDGTDRNVRGVRTEKDLPHLIQFQCKSEAQLCSCFRLISSSSFDAQPLRSARLMAVGGECAIDRGAPEEHFWRDQS